MRNYQQDFRTRMDALYKDGKEPGLPEGPEEARGCDHCKFGVISQPMQLWHCGVPPFIARAMARDIGGLCYVVYCDCIAGQHADALDAKRRAQLEGLHTTQTHGKQGFVAWDHTQPDDYVPGLWWQKVSDACANGAGG